MSNSYNTQCELERLAEELETHVGALRDAIYTLKRLEETKYYQDEIKEIKERTKRWLK